MNINDAIVIADPLIKIDVNIVLIFIAIVYVQLVGSIRDGLIVRNIDYLTSHISGFSNRDWISIFVVIALKGVIISFCNIAVVVTVIAFFYYQHKLGIYIGNKIESKYPVVDGDPKPSFLVFRLWQIIPPVLFFFVLKILSWLN